MTSRAVHLHDAEVVGVEVGREEDTLVLLVEAGDGLRKRLEFSGVVMFRIVDFVHQNVVSRALLSSASDFSDDKLDYWVRWLSTLSDTGCLMSDAQVLSTRQQIVRGERLLFVLEPSAGAEIAVLATSFQIR